MTQRKKIERTPHTQLFNEVLEGIAYAKLKPTEWQFIMVLWRLTYGRKNMPSEEGGGKWTTWSNAEFHRRTGLAREVISRLKASLLQKKVIVKRKNTIGFNKHFENWTKGSILTKPSIMTKQSLLTKQSILTEQSIDQTDNRVLSKQSTTIDQTDNMDAPEPVTPAHLQSLKKERKKETISDDKNFSIFWERYPKKRGKIEAQKAYLKYLEAGAFIPEQLINLLIKYKDQDWAGREMKFIPHAASWLNKQPWEDEKPVIVSPAKEKANAALKIIDRRWQTDEIDLVEKNRLVKDVTNTFNKERKRESK